MPAEQYARSETPDDDAWEDLSDADEPNAPPDSYPPSAQATPRKRRAHKSVFVASTKRPPSFNVSVKKQPKITHPALSKEVWMDSLLQGSIIAFRYSADVIGRAIRLLRRPLSVLLFLWMLALIISRITYIFRTALAPLCILPGVSSLALCKPVSATPSRLPHRADYPKLVDVQSASFEQLLDEFAGTSGLSLDIKKAEIATTDLVTLIKYSQLKSKDMLAETLARFVNDAKTAGRGLQKLNAKIGGAVDGIMAVNDYALHSIEEAYARDSSFSVKALIPWSSGPTTSEIVTKTFTEAMNVFSYHLERLILEAEASLANLDRLEERLTTLYDMMTREDSSISAAKSELLLELWTILGGNRGPLRDYDNHLQLLKNLGNYRKKALAHVVAALQTLRQMSDDMEDLRERVAAPDIAGLEIPVDVHMKSIQSGLQRLKEGRIKAREREEAVVRRVLELTDE